MNDPRTPPAHHGDEPVLFIGDLHLDPARPGMIEVFDVMAISGTGNARSMASGVSKATIPTMAGMVGALSGVFLVTILTRNIERQVESLEEDLELDH